MEKEIIPSPEDQKKKEIWLNNLADFIVEANRNTYAADADEVKPQRPGYKELEYKRGDWQLRDNYVGYFRAPGMTTVYYKDIPAWTMSYGGEGMNPDSYELTKQTFTFLKSALIHVNKKLPYRGPEEFKSGE